MVDLFSIAQSGVLALRVARWLNGGDLDRLLDLLDAHFGEETGLSAAELGTWRDNQDFKNALFLIDASGRWEEYRSDLERAVAGMTVEDPTRPTEAEADLVSEVVAAIKVLLPYAKKGDSLLRHEARKLEAALEEGRGPRALRLDWAPERAEDFVAELAASESEEALSLERALDGKDRGQVVAGLIGQPPAWVAKGSGLLFEVLAVLAENEGEWELALQAWAEAESRPGADRTRALVRSSIAAGALGRDEDAEAFLKQARVLEDDHPLLLLAEAQRETDPDRKLELVAEVKPRKPSQEAAKVGARAEAEIAGGNVEAARAALEEAEHTGLSPQRLEEIRAELAMEQSRQDWLTGRRVEVAVLKEAAKVFERQRDQHRNLRAYRGSVHFTVRAADARLRANDPAGIVEMLAPANLLDEELAVPEARLAFAELLTRAARSDLALEMLPAGEAADGPGSLVRALAQVQAGDETELENAVTTLNAELSGEHCQAAAMGLLTAAAVRGQPWNERAEAVVRAADEGLARSLKAQWLSDQGRSSDAERELEPVATEPRAQHGLMEIALAEGDREKAGHRIEMLLAGDPDYAARLDAARAYIEIGDSASAGNEFERLKSDVNAPVAIRVNALRHLAQVASEAERYLKVLEITSEWLALRPDESAAWGRAHAFARLGRFDDALAVMGDCDLEPRDLPEAQMVARILLQAVGGESAMRLVLELADNYDPPDEDLEALAAISLLGLPEPISDELVERANAARFVERFPESGRIWSVKAPKTPQEIKEFIQEMTGGRQAALEQAESEVFELGTAPVAYLALAGGKQVGESWRVLGRRPIAYGDPNLEELERADAATSLSLGAIWDPSSIATASGLSPEASDLFRQVLPRSVIAQGTLDDLASEGPRPEEESVRRTLGTNPTGEPILHEWSADELEEEKRWADAMAKLAGELHVEPDAPPDDGGPEAQLLRDEKLEDLPVQIRTWAGTYAVARRLNLAVFSDDRLIRLRARQSGIRAFGTAALLEALRLRGDLNEADILAARRALRYRGTAGFLPSEEEIVAEVRSADYLLSPELALMLGDPGWLDGGPERGLRLMITLLREVAAEAPDELEKWFARVLDVIHQRLRHVSHMELASTFLLLAWPRTEEEAGSDFFSDLAAVSRGALHRLNAVGNPIRACFSDFLDAAMSISSVRLRLTLIRSFLDAVPLEERHQLREAMIPKPRRP